MRLKHLAACASLLAAAACDGATTHPVPTPDAPRLATSAPRWSLYTGQTPTEVLDASPGWEVGTRFSSSKPGKIVGFRFYRAAGETGSNYGKLWSSSGQRLKLSNAFPSGTGWVTVMLDTPVEITANATYRVSVNTNTKQAKKGGAYVFDGHLGNGPLFSDGGYYGQPVNAMPNSESASYYFVDVIFEEHVPPPALPNLYVGDINPFSGSSVVVRICNNGTATADPSTAQYYHFRAPPVGPGQVQALGDLPTPAIAAGQCVNLPPVSDPSAVGYFHDYQVRADFYNVVQESNENDNWAQRTWRRY